MADVGEHLLKALLMPMAGYTGDASKVDPITLAVAMLTYGSALGWDVVQEIGHTNQ